MNVIFGQSELCKNCLSGGLVAEYIKIFVCSHKTCKRCKMEGLKLSDQEQRFYGELFQTCDSDVSGKISGIKALELFRASGLKQEALHQVRMKTCAIVSYPVSLRYASLAGSSCSSPTILSNVSALMRKGCCPFTCVAVVYLHAEHFICSLV